jgi:pyruvate formate lyase activating enzyme
VEAGMRHDALLYDELDQGWVQCHLCAHRCKISEGRRGICRVRENYGGKLFSLVYGNLLAQNADPIEKKPLYHFYPGSKSYSVATPGCNFRCEWCQNWQISQMPKLMSLSYGQRTLPADVVEKALAMGCQSIAYTYTEPTIFFEFSLDTARLAKEAGLKNIYVTNGYMTPEMIELIHPYLDAANVDIKAYKDATYHKLMGGHLEPVLESCRMMRSLGIWLEITTLIVPGMNDDPHELRDLALFIHENLSSSTPWHLSRFYPQYKMLETAPTNRTILHETKQMAHEIGLNYIYIGNLYGRDQTNCKVCGQVLIDRSGYSILITQIDADGCCQHCGTKLDGDGIGSY